MTAISRSKVKIWISDVDTDASSLVTTGTTNLAPIEGEIKNYAKSGGEQDVESDPHFGGFVDKEKPASQVELSFEITPSLENGDRWAALSMAVDGSNAGVYTLAASPADKSVFIEAVDGSNYASWAFNNCNVTMLDVDHSADDNQTNNLTLKFSPTDENGVSNVMMKAGAVTGMPNWTALDNN